MTETPAPELQPPPPIANRAFPRWALSGLVVISLCLMVANALFAYGRESRRLSHLTESAELDAYKMGSALASVILPGFVVVLVLAFSKCNRKERASMALFCTCVLITISSLNQGLRPPTPSWRIVPGSNPGAQRLHSERPRFTLEIPQGFAVIHAAKQAPSLLHAFSGPLADEQDANAAITIALLPGAISTNVDLNRRRLLETMPANAQLTNKLWRGHSIDTCIVSAKTNGEDFVIYQMRVPLTPRALDVSVYGLARHQQALDALADSLLSTLDGPTNR